MSEPDGWWLLRASGTEPKLTVRCEAADESGLERLRQTVGTHLAACGIELTSARSNRAGAEPGPACAAKAR